jgi:hypothetical protein
LQTEFMKRRFVQIILLASLLAGSAAQILACGSMVEDRHPCCRALATSKARTPSHSLKKVQPADSFRGNSCGCTSAPATPRENPVGSNTNQQPQKAAIPDNQSAVALAFRQAVARPIRLQLPDADSPPHFILYGSLLI